MAKGKEFGLHDSTYAFSADVDAKIDNPAPQDGAHMICVYNVPAHASSQKHDKIYHEYLNNDFIRVPAVKKHFVRFEVVGTLLGASPRALTTEFSGNPTMFSMNTPARLATRQLGLYSCTMPNLTYDHFLHCIRNRFSLAFRAGIVLLRYRDLRLHSLLRLSPAFR
jgi:hypothetical protein